MMLSMQQYTNKVYYFNNTIGYVNYMLYAFKDKILQLLIRNDFILYIENKK